MRLILKEWRYGNILVMESKSILDNMTMECFKSIFSLSLSDPLSSLLLSHLFSSITLGC